MKSRKTWIFSRSRSSFPKSLNSTCNLVSTRIPTSNHCFSRLSLGFSPKNTINFKYPILKDVNLKWENKPLRFFHLGSWSRQKYRLLLHLPDRPTFPLWVYTLWADSTLLDNNSVARNFLYSKNTKRFSNIQYSNITFGLNI